MNLRYLSELPFRIIIPVFFVFITITSGNTLHADESVTSREGWTPLQLSIFNPLQVFNERKDVYGLRLNVLYGVNRDLYGFDLGLVNKADDVYGIQLGIIRNIVKGDMGGFQLGIANDVDGDMFLMQTAFNSNGVEGNAIGIQTAVMGNFVISERKPFGFRQWLYFIWDPAAALHSLLGGKSEEKGNMYGVQTAMINGVACGMNGLQTGLFYNLAGSLNGIQLVLIENVVAEDADGIQFALGYNRAGGDMTGIQTSMYRNSTGGSMNGVQLSVIANNSAEMNGIQIAAVNLQSLFTEDTSSNGIQIGLINYSECMRGVQIGIINWSRRMVGVQIGLINIINDNPVPVMPLFNVSTSF